MNTDDLASQSCTPCQGKAEAMTKEVAIENLSLVPGWRLNELVTEISRRFTLKGFAKAVYTANVAAHLSDQVGHHADISFGWGYCEIKYTTHEIGGLSENDFICAAKLNARLEQ